MYTFSIARRPLKLAISGLMAVAILALPACGSNSGGNKSGSGMSDAAFCKELDDLWGTPNRGVLSVLMEVNSDRRAGKVPVSVDHSKLQGAITDAKKLAADAPADALSEGKKLKDYFTDLADFLTGAAKGSTSEKQFDPIGEIPMGWQAGHCS